MNKQIVMATMGFILAACPFFSHADELCSYAPSKSYVVNRISSGLGGAGTGALAVMHTTGLSMVADGSGSYVLAGAGGVVAGSSIAIPALIVASVAAVGAGIALELGCIKKNHPDTARSIEKHAESLHQSALAVFR